MVIVKEKDEYGYEKIVFRKGSPQTQTSTNTPNPKQSFAKRPTRAEERLAQPLEQRLESAKRTVCWILRHGALKLGINITTDGFVYLDDLIVREEFVKLGITPEQVRDIILTETKYYDVFTDNDSKVNVRAKWGHSMEGITTKYQNQNVDQKDQSTPN